MRRSLLASLILAMFAVIGNVRPAGAQNIGVEEIERGMTGYALTVVEGTRIDTMSVEVLDVIEGRAAGTSSILVRVSGAGTELSGIVAGMSGSPVYFDGRLAGALAYTWSGARIPIGGVTPIAEMLTLYDREDREVSLRAEITPPTDEKSASSFDGRPRRIATPVAVSGFAPEVADEIDQFFGDRGMVTTIGGGGAKTNAEEGWEPIPGASVGVRLLSGDANLTAIGVITHVEGDRILAFGHPMFQAGGVRFPLVSTEIHAVMPSRGLSFKIGSPIETIGSMVQDRSPGIAGDFTVEASTIPIEITVDVPGIGTETARFEAIEHPMLTPSLAAWAVTNTVLRREKSWGIGTVRVTLDADLEASEDLHLENLYSSSGFVRAAGADVAMPLQLLANNPLSAVKVKDIRVHVEVTDGRKVARIEEMRVEKSRVRPGETVRGSFWLKHFQGDVEEVSFAVTVPHGQAEGKVLLRTCDAVSSEVWDDKRAPNRFGVKSADALVRLLHEMRTSDRVYCQIYDDSPRGITVDGRAMPDLPSSMMSVYTEPGHADDGAIRRGVILAEQSIPFDVVVYGCKALPIWVDRNAP